MNGYGMVQWDNRFAARAAAFPAAVLAHAAVVILLVAVPLLRPGSGPRIEVREAMLLPAPPSPPPPLPGLRRGAAGERRLKAVAVAARDAGRFVAPVEIPDVIEDEALIGGGGGGIDGGVDDGLLPGLPLGVVGNVLENMIGEEMVPVRAGNSVQAPRLVHRVPPVYPEFAREVRVSGVVILEAVTDVYGRVRDVRVLRSIPLLDDAAVDAVRRWVYEPMVVNGRPRGVVFTVTVRFELKDAGIR